ncbi:MAG: S9 family peptidase [Elusimicrobia bacterium]|nr:S9 family peptidase [Elusimicrobiota bacterium]
MRSLFVLVVLCLTPAAVSAADSGIVEHKGRRIDVMAHLEGFPYTAPIVDLQAGRLFYKKKGAVERLMMQSFDPAKADKVDLAAGKIISPKDFSKRNFWGAFWSPATEKLVIKADENNDEVINFYEVDPNTGDEKRLTNVGYVYGSRTSRDGRYVAYESRATKDETSRGDVRVLDLKTGQERIVYKDSVEIKATWGALSWQPNGRGLLVPFLASSLRAKYNLLYVPLQEGKEPKVITDVAVKRAVLYPLNEWLNDEEFLYASDEADFVGIYKGSLKGGSTLISRTGENVKGAVVVYDGKAPRVASIVGDPLKSTLRVFDPSTGKTFFEREFPGRVGFDDAHDNRLAFYASSLSNPFSQSELTLTDGKASVLERTSYPDALLGKIVNCVPEKVSFETFDKPEVPGEKGTLHGYLLSPKKPLDGADRRALILSFYGGGNSYSTTFQVLCEAGYYVLSPAPRGTSEFGATFFNLGNGDWGGGETLDDFAAGRYLSKRLSLPQKKIGIFGGSRGGYDAMRALTFPGEVNGVKDSFRFGFGISDYGISDVIRAYEQGNISQWYVTLTGGDPRKDAPKWKDRSPEAHADLLDAPLLLTHGSTDRRVPVAESRAMYEKAKGLGKDVRYVEFPGQGHGYKGTDALARYYETVLGFLGSLK